MTAIKSHNGKPPMDLLPMRALCEVARAFASGIRGGRKPWDWLKGADHSLYRAAALRHIAEDQDGVECDAESGCRPIAHAIASLLILLTYQILGIGNDDRPRKPEA